MTRASGIGGMLDRAVRAILPYAATLILLASGLHAQSNKIKSIKTVGSNIEITVQSPQGFDVRDEVVVLQIGAYTFSVSRSPDSGDAQTLIFVLTTAEFSQLSSGDPVSVGWGSDGSSNRKNFGTLDKSILDK
jgi:hypothetical protein